MPPHREPPFRLGIIGCGNVLSAYRQAIDLLRLRNLVRVTAACGRENQRERVARDLQISNFVTDPQKIIGDDGIDIVLVLTSMVEHGALARAALEAGKHVLVEKPLAVSFDEAKLLIETARRSQRYLLCAPFTVLSPTFQTIARRIRNGDIGKPCSARARYGWSGPWWGEWFYRPGGGCVFDLGVYGLTSLTGLLGPAKRVMAMTGIAIPEREVNGRTIRVEAEDNAQIVLDFGEGAFAVVTTGFTLQQYRSPALEVYGTTGVIQMLGDDWDPDGYELWQNAAGAWQLFQETDPDWLWTDGLRHLIDCLCQDAPPIATPEHALHVLEIMVKAQQSGREGRALPIESRFEPLRLSGSRAPAAAAAHWIHDRTRAHESVPPNSA